MSDKEFDKLIDIALNGLPLEFLAKLENVSLVIEDWPRQDQVKRLSRKGRGGLVLGLYEGIPQTKRGRYGIGPTLPDKITIFKTPILMVSRSYDDVVEIIKETVIHEIAHHFGMSEKAIRDARGSGRKIH